MIFKIAMIKISFNFIVKILRKTRGINSHSFRHDRVKIAKENSLTSKAIIARPEITETKRKKQTLFSA